MADALIATGLARGVAEVEAGLWEIDIRIIQQLLHARGVRNGNKLKWRGLGPGDESMEKRMRTLQQRDFSWQSEPR